MIEKLNKYNDNIPLKGTFGVFNVKDNHSIYTPNQQKINEAVEKLSKWIFETEEKILIEHFADYNIESLKRLKSVINNVVERKGKERS